MQIISYHNKNIDTVDTELPLQIKRFLSHDEIPGFIPSVVACSEVEDAGKNVYWKMHGGQSSKKCENMSIIALIHYVGHKLALSHHTLNLSLHSIAYVSALVFCKDIII